VFAWRLCETMEMKQFPPSLSRIFVAVLKTDSAAGVCLAARLAQSILASCYLRYSESCLLRGRSLPGTVCNCSYTISVSIGFIFDIATAYATLLLTEDW
jgi:hypothetical protein